MTTDIQFLHDLRSDLEHAASNPATPNRSRHHLHRAGVRPKSATTRIIAASVAVVAASVLAVIFVGHSNTRITSATKSQVRAVPQLGVAVRGGPWSAEHPFPTGHPASLDQAQAALGAAIPLPSDPLTDQTHMGAITLISGGHLNGVPQTWVAISYPDSNLAVEYQTPVPYPDPLANYRAYVSESPPALLQRDFAFVGSVAGQPALVINLHADSTRTNPASVEFVLQGVKIAVIGYQPASTLLRISDSIAGHNTASQPRS
jgi:hypothetical protein